MAAAVVAGIASAVPTASSEMQTVKTAPKAEAHAAAPAHSAGAPVIVADSALNKTISYTEKSAASPDSAKAKASIDTVRADVIQSLSETPAQPETPAAPAKPAAEKPASIETRTLGHDQYVGVFKSLIEESLKKDGKASLDSIVMNQSADSVGFRVAINAAGPFGTTIKVHVSGSIVEQGGKLLIVNPEVKSFVGQKKASERIMPLLGKIPSDFARHISAENGGKEVKKVSIVSRGLAVEF